MSNRSPKICPPNFIALDNWSFSSQIPKPKYALVRLQAAKNLFAGIATPLWVIRLPSLYNFLHNEECILQLLPDIRLLKISNLHFLKLRIVRTMSHSITLTTSIPIISPSHWTQTLGPRRVPSDTEANEIQNVISYAESDLYKVENEIDRVQEVLSQLCRRRDEISEHISNHRALLSPVRKVPDELLAEIFTYCLPWFSEKKAKNNAFLRREAPLLLAQICSRWRTVAISTQELWSFIRIEYGKFTLHRDMANMALWLERSGTYPLSLVLHERNEARRNDVDNDKISSPMLDILLPTSYRWRYAEILVTRNTICNLSPIKGTLPLLQSLAIGVYGSGYDFVPLTCDVFDIAPKLRSLGILGYGMMSVTLSIPWHLLTEFACYDTPYGATRCLDILRHCPNLSSCSFRTLHDTPVDPSTHPLYHPKLRSLSIPPEYPVGAVFDRLTVPALRVVHLKEARLSSSLDWPGAHFLNLLKRSGCTLKKCTWGLASVSVENIKPYLEAMPDLEELAIETSLGWALPELLQALCLGMADEARNCFCPKLKAIQLSVDHTLNAQDLYNFVKSRWNIGGVPCNIGRLQSIRLSLRGLDKKVLRCLKEFQDGGLDVVIANVVDDDWR
jgi:hypothetical protein